MAVMWLTGISRPHPYLTAHSVWPALFWNPHADPVRCFPSPHLTQGETGAQRGWATCPGPHSQEVLELIFDSGQPTPCRGAWESSLPLGPLLVLPSLHTHPGREVLLSL